jgi:hypothetical protein
MSPLGGFTRPLSGKLLPQENDSLVKFIPPISKEVETVIALSKLSAGALKAKHGSNPAALKSLNPVKGFINEAAGALCTRKGDICFFAPCLV